MKISVGVFFGGRSVEHEISVISAIQAIKAFDTDKYNILPVYITKEGNWYTGNVLLEMDNYKNIDALLEKAEQVYMTPATGDFNIYKTKTSLLGSKVSGKIDIAFPIFHGTNGEDGTIQGFFDLKNIPYAGSDLLSSANGMDKVVMKMILKESGIPVVDYLWFYDKEWHLRQELWMDRIKKLGYPVIVKPANLGSSIGITRVSGKEELMDAIDLAGSFARRILVEKMVVNLKEINCAVLGDAESAIASVCEEPLRSGEILSYTDKYMSKGSSGSKGMSSTQRRIPADIPKEKEEAIKDLAIRTFQKLDCAGVARIDFLTNTESGNIYVNEINSIPGSLSFYLWEPSGISFNKLLDRMIELALKRQREKDQLTVNFEENIFKLGGVSPKLGKA